MSEIAEHEHEHKHEATGGHAAHGAAMPAQVDDLNTPVLAVVGFVSAILTFAIVMGLQATYHQYAGILHIEKVENVKSDQAATILSGQKASLRDYGWVDKAAGKVRVPIDRAMQLVVNEYSTKAK